MQNDTKNLHFLSYISGKVARDRQTNFKSPVLLHIEYREREREEERKVEGKARREVERPKKEEANVVGLVRRSDRGNPVAIMRGIPPRRN